ncbi:helix-turn-helix domain-containing protein [Flectobacillus roseus]
MDIFSKNLIRYRQNLNLTQEYIAEELGIRQSTYCEWEKGRSPKLKYLPKLKEILRLKSIDELFKDSYLHKNEQSEI